MASSLLSGIRGGLNSRYSLFHRYSSTYSVKSSDSAGYVLGVYSSDSDKNAFTLTPSAQKYASPSLIDLISSSGPVLKAGKCRVLSHDSKRISIVGLPNSSPEKDHSEEINGVKDGIRNAIAAGVKALSAYEDVKEIYVDDVCDPESASEGAHLSLWKYEELKKKKNNHKPDLKLLEKIDDQAEESWKNGALKAEGQNLARTLMETPANYCTPTKFSEFVSDRLKSLDVDVKIYDKAWAESMKMGSFLSVSAGSAEPPVFLELTYGSKHSEKPFVLVGKGVTFDTGGISIKPSKNMDAMRADMGGAAVTFGTFYSVASLNLPVHLKVLIPLCENMPGSRATKPGDVVTAMNGKTIQVDNTDAEGRLILADALCYADTFKPQVVSTVATLTGAMAVALGASATGVFTNSRDLWPLLHQSGMTSGDRVWRMPLWDIFTKQMTECRLADLNNIGSKGVGGSCTAAAFLKEFTDNENYFHFDIAGVMDNSDEVPYLGKGMSGRPTRTLVEFIKRINA